MVSIKNRPDKPAATDVAYCRNQAPPSLTAQGQNLKWYTDAGLANKIAEGSSFLPLTASSTTYYVTQTIGDCESESAAVKWQIKEAPASPEVHTTFLCNGIMQAPLRATGTHISWYSDETLTQKIGEGTEYFSTNFTADYIYVTQQVNSCPSTFTKVELLEGNYNFKQERVPNIITPNGDEKNDVFRLPSLSDDSCIGNFVGITIYNRWGKEVYTNKDKNFVWNADGMSNGVYYYSLSFTNFTYKGTVSVMR